MKLWWDDFLKVLRAHVKSSHRVVLFVDSNSKVGSVSGDHVGDFRAEAQNHSGFFSLNFLGACAHSPLLPLSVLHKAIASTPLNIQICPTTDWITRAFH